MLFRSCSFVVESEVWEPDSSSSIFLSQDCFVYSGSFVFPCFSFCLFDFVFTISLAFCLSAFFLLSSIYVYIFIYIYFYFYFVFLLFVFLPPSLFLFFKIIFVSLFCFFASFFSWHTALVLFFRFCIFVSFFLINVFIYLLFFFFACVGSSLPHIGFL